MAIMITRIEDAESRALKVDGFLAAQDVAVLVDACAGATGGLRLDLRDLRSADRRGVDTLRALRARGVTFTGLCPYLDLLLGGTRR